MPDHSRIHVEAIRIFTLTQYLCGGGDDGDYEESRLANLGRIVSFVEREEHPVVQFCYETSKLFSRVCNHDPRTLELSLRLIAKVCITVDGAIMSDHGHTFQLEYVSCKIYITKFSEFKV